MAQLPSHMMHSEKNGNLRPPPYRQSISRYNLNKSSRCKCVLKYICCCCCCILSFLLVILAGFFIYSFTFYRPQMPKYEVQALEVEALDIQPDSSLLAEIVVIVKAVNPNKLIGFKYGDSNSVQVSFKETTICSGKFPGFHQSQHNTTVIQIPLKGKNPFDKRLQEALMHSKNNGLIPLMVEVKAPVEIVLFDRFHFKEVTVDVNVFIVVDDLSPHQKVNILSKDTRISGLKF